MKALASEYTVRDLCAALQVSRSGYYGWGGHQSGLRAQANRQLMESIRILFTKSRESYGSPRMTAALRQSGQVCNHKRVERLMRQHGLKGRLKRRYRVVTTDSRHDHPIAPNRLAEAPACTAPDQVWLTDITYVPTQEGWLYLAGVLDLYSRKAVGWAMGESLATTLTLGALEMALEQRRPGKGLLHHSDRGVQYASQDYQQRLEAAEVKISMSRKGNCYDNATMESFWSTLKQELVYRCRFDTRAQARQCIFEWIEIFYNRTRLHSSLGYKSPVDFENQLN
jgi:transposase InsO family protein